MRQAYVNERGLELIHDWLGLYDKKGYDHFTREMLIAWADDIYFQSAEGNMPELELRSFETVTGRTEIFKMPDEGIDWIEVSEENEE